VQSLRGCTGSLKTMLIDFECSGGYAGLQLAYHADTDELPEKVRDELLSLVKDSGVFDMKPDRLSRQQAAYPDAMNYRLSLSEGGREISLLLDDAAVPESLRPLLSRLQDLAQGEGT